MGVVESALGRVIAVFEKYDEEIVFEKTVELVGDGTPVACCVSALPLFSALANQTEPKKLLPVCSASEWFASHTLPFAVCTLHECLKAHDCSLPQPLALL